MARNVFKTALVIVSVAAFGAEARAEEGIVLPKAPGVVSRSNNNERRPPQAPPADPSKDPNAPPDARRVSQAVGAFFGGLIGFGSCSLLKESPTATCVSIGIVVGTLIGGR